MVKRIITCHSIILGLKGIIKTNFQTEFQYKNVVKHKVFPLLRNINVWAQIPILGKLPLYMLICSFWVIMLNQYVGLKTTTHLHK